MAERLIARFTKPDVTFASAEEAQQDRKQFFSAALLENMSTTYAALQSAGIIISGPTIAWDSANNILTIERVVSSYADLQAWEVAQQNPLRNQIESASTQAGWTRLDFNVVPV